MSDGYSHRQFGGTPYRPLMATGSYAPLVEQGGDREAVERGLDELARYLELHARFDEYCRTRERTGSASG